MIGRNQIGKMIIEKIQCTRGICQTFWARCLMPFKKDMYQTPCHMYSELKRIVKNHSANNSTCTKISSFDYSCDSLSNIQFFMLNTGMVPEVMYNFSFSIGL